LLERTAIQITSGTFSWESEDQPTLKKLDYLSAFLSQIITKRYIAKIRLSDSREM
jgi:hypothetical protein